VPAATAAGSFFVYVLQSEETGRYYIGCSKDVACRLAQHNVGMSKATRELRPWQLVHTEAYQTLAEARRREAQIKSWKNPEYMRRALGLTG
jgi:putative endonuclease